MRLDKYLKLSRLIKRRTIAAEAASAGRILQNGKVAKASSTVLVGDVLEIRLGENVLKVRVLDIREHVLKDGATELYEVVTDE